MQQVSQCWSQSPLFLATGCPESPPSTINAADCLLAGEVGCIPQLQEPSLCPSLSSACSHGLQDCVKKTDLQKQTAISTACDSLAFLTAAGKENKRGERGRLN